MAGFIVIWLLFALGVAWLADTRGRSGLAWFLLSVLLSPLIAFVALLVTRDLAKEAEELARRQADEAKAEQKAEQLRREEHERQLESIRVLAQTPATAAADNHQTPPISVADEIRKLAALRSDGLLTEEEFNAQKARVLSGRGENA